MLLYKIDHIDGFFTQQQYIIKNFLECLHFETSSVLLQSAEHCSADNGKNTIIMIYIYIIYIIYIYILYEPNLISGYHEVRFPSFSDTAAPSSGKLPSYSVLMEEDVMGRNKKSKTASTDT